MVRLLFLFLATLLSIPAALGQTDSEWTWIHGQLDSRIQQRKYLEYAKQMYDWYQGQGSMTGRLVAEADLESLPTGKVVVIGPLKAFGSLERYGLPIEVAADGAVTIGGRVFEGRRIGIYLENRTKTRIAFLGLSVPGFRGIFSVPTDSKACTVTGGKSRVIYEGDWGEDGLVLHGTPYTKTFPTEDELRDLTLPAVGLTVGPVVTGPDAEALDPEFEKWLAGFVEGRRVLFVGEYHWSRGVSRLFNQIVEELLEQGRLRAVFLEANYSFSGFFDHYASEPDDEKAARFLKTRLHPLVNSPGTLELLEILRAWNSAHPDQKARIGCLDMEWNSPNVIRNIIEPYFRRVDGDFSIPDPALFRRTGKERAQELLARAREEGIQGEYPFLTPEYVGRVLTNFWDTQEIEDQLADRQCWIIRNVTEFHGDLLKDGLAVFKGGGYHAIKRKFEEEDYYREAAYLDLEFAPTRGKVATLYLQALSYRLGVIADVDTDKRMQSATGYQMVIRDFRKALAEDHADRDAHYLLDSGGLNDFERIIAGTGYRMGWNVLRVASADWETLARTYGPEVMPSQALDYDATVYILRADLEVMRPLEFAED